MGDTTETVLKLRKVTRTLADSLHAQMSEYLATLMPLFRPKTVLGDYVQGPGAKEAPKRADKAFKELQSAWTAFGPGRPIAGDRALNPPLELSAGGLEVSPVEYAYHMTRGSDSKAFMVRAPLKWTLSYSGFGPAALAELMHSKGRGSLDELQRFALHYLVLHVVIANQPGLSAILEALHFPITFERSDRFGGLPVPIISCAVSTRRPSDDVILQSAELTGMNAFEEIVVVSDIERLADPLQQRMLDAVRGVDSGLLAARR
jgi:hypothetical protein